MRNDVENCWFYKLCRKSCTKDVTFILVGIVLLAIALILFKWVISTIQILMIIGGIGLIIGGFSAFFKKLPEVKRFLSSMSPEKFDSLGTEPPSSWYGQIYMTRYYMCIPGEYIMIPYGDIADIQVVRNISDNKVKSYNVNFTVKGRKDTVDVIVTDWQNFEFTKESFFGELNERRNEAFQMLNN